MSNPLDPTLYSGPIANMPPGMKAQYVSNLHYDKTTQLAALSRRYDQLLRSEKYCDCSFHIDGTIVKAHKLILTAASPVFEAMFYGPMCEQQAEIDITDMSAEIFKALVAYIYAGAVDFESLTLEDTIELYYGAEKYLLNDLIADCLKSITRKLRFANILPALELAICMDLKGLLEVCMTFFTRCCLSDTQFRAYLKSHYMHVSKECVKAIIASNKNLHQHLLWFVYEWCQQERREMGLQESECALIIEDLQLKVNGLDNLRDDSRSQPCCTIERTYYRACCPFTVSEEAHEWKLLIKSNRFISLQGIVMNSRYTPNLWAVPIMNLPTEYKENMTIVITALEQTPAALPASSDSEEDSDGDTDRSPAGPCIIWRHSVAKQLTKYNCDLNIRWTERVILSPEINYEIKLMWQTDAYGAEYPCSFQSVVVDGIQFKDSISYNGSFIKGLHILNLT